jgi:hypothetical protein
MVGIIFSGVHTVTILGEIVRTVNPLDGLVVLSVLPFVVNRFGKRRAPGDPWVYGQTLVGRPTLGELGLPHRRCWAAGAVRRAGY